MSLNFLQKSPIEILNFLTVFQVLDLVVSRDNRGRKVPEYLIHFFGWNSRYILKFSLFTTLVIEKKSLLLNTV